MIGKSPTAVLCEVISDGKVIGEGRESVTGRIIGTRKLNLTG